MAIRILVSSKKNIVSEGICAVIDRSDELQLSGLAEDAASALALCQTVKPQVIVATNELPGLTDISRFVSEISSASPLSKVVLIANVSNRQTAFEIFSAGVMAFISPTDNDVHELPLAIKSAADGRIFLGQSAPKTLLYHAYSVTPNQRVSPVELGDREEQVLILLANGNSSKKIAQLLHISTSTVEVHRRNIMNKTGLHNIADLTRFAIRNRFITV